MEQQSSGLWERRSWQKSFSAGGGTQTWKVSSGRGPWLAVTISDPFAHGSFLQLGTCVPRRASHRHWPSTDSPTRTSTCIEHLHSAYCTLSPVLSPEGTVDSPGHRRPEGHISAPVPSPASCSRAQEVASDRWFKCLGLCRPVSPSWEFCAPSPHCCRSLRIRPQ